MRSGRGHRIVVAGLFILAMIFAAVGCGTSNVSSYRASLTDTGQPRFNLHSLRIEHDLLNARYQYAEKEAWEDD